MYALSSRRPNRHLSNSALDGARGDPQKGITIYDTLSSLPYPRPRSGGRYGQMQAVIDSNKTTAQHVYHRDRSMRPPRKLAPLERETLWGQKVSLHRRGKGREFWLPSEAEPLHNIDGDFTNYRNMISRAFGATPDYYPPPGRPPSVTNIHPDQCGLFMSQMYPDEPEDSPYGSPWRPTVLHKMSDEVVHDMKRDDDKPAPLCYSFGVTASGANCAACVHIPVRARGNEVPVLSEFHLFQTECIPRMEGMPIGPYALFNCRRNIWSWQGRSDSSRSMSLMNNADDVQGCEDTSVPDDNKEESRNADSTAESGNEKEEEVEEEDKEACENSDSEIFSVHCQIGAENSESEDTDVNEELARLGRKSTESDGSELVSGFNQKIKWKLVDLDFHGISGGCMVNETEDEQALSSPKEDKKNSLKPRKNAAEKHSFQSRHYVERQLFIPKSKGTSREPLPLKRPPLKLVHRSTNFSRKLESEDRDTAMVRLTKVPTRLQRRLLSPPNDHLGMDEDPFTSENKNNKPDIFPLVALPGSGALRKPLTATPIELHFSPNAVRSKGLMMRAASQADRQSWWPKVYYPAPENQANPTSTPTLEDPEVENDKFSSLLGKLRFTVPCCVNDEKELEGWTVEMDIDEENTLDDRSSHKLEIQQTADIEADLYEKSERDEPTNNSPGLGEAKETHESRSSSFCLREINEVTDNAPGQTHEREQTVGNKSDLIQTDKPDEITNNATDVSENYASSMKTCSVEQNPLSEIGEEDELLKVSDSQKKASYGEQNYQICDIAPETSPEELMILPDDLIRGSPPEKVPGNDSLATQGSDLLLAPVMLSRNKKIIWNLVTLDSEETNQGCAVYMPRVIDGPESDSESDPPKTWQPKTNPALQKIARQNRTTVMQRLTRVPDRYKRQQAKLTLSSYERENAQNQMYVASGNEVGTSSERRPLKATTVRLQYCDDSQFDPDVYWPAFLPRRRSRSCGMQNRHRARYHRRPARIEDALSREEADVGQLNPGCYEISIEGNLFTEDYIDNFSEALSYSLPNEYTVQSKQLHGCRTMDAIAYAHAENVLARERDFGEQQGLDMDFVLCGRRLQLHDDSTTKSLADKKDEAHTSSAMLGSAAAEMKQYNEKVGIIDSYTFPYKCVTHHSTHHDHTFEVTDFDTLQFNRIVQGDVTVRAQYPFSESPWAPYPGSPDTRSKTIPLRSQQGEMFDGDKSKDMVSCSSPSVDLRNNTPVDKQHFPGDTFLYNDLESTRHATVIADHPEGPQTTHPTVSQAGEPPSRPESSLLSTSENPENDSEDQARDSYEEVSFTCDITDSHSENGSVSGCGKRDRCVEVPGKTFTGENGTHVEGQYRAPEPPVVRILSALKRCGQEKGHGTGVFGGMNKNVRFSDADNKVISFLNEERLSLRSGGLGTTPQMAEKCTANAKEPVLTKLTLQLTPGAGTGDDSSQAGHETPKQQGSPFNSPGIRQSLRVTRCIANTGSMCIKGNNFGSLSPSSANTNSISGWNGKEKTPGTGDGPVQYAICQHCLLLNDRLRRFSGNDPSITAQLLKMKMQDKVAEGGIKITAMPRARTRL